MFPYKEEEEEKGSEMEQCGSRITEQSHKGSSSFINDLLMSQGIFC